MKNLLLARSVEDLGLSTRVSNCLRAAQIKTIGDLVTKSEGEMLQYPNFGRKSLMEINRKLVEIGLRSAPAEPDCVPVGGGKWDRQRRIEWLKENIPTLRQRLRKFQRELIQIESGGAR